MGEVGKEGVQGVSHGRGKICGFSVWLLLISVTLPIQRKVLEGILGPCSLELLLQSENSQKSPTLLSIPQNPKEQGNLEPAIATPQLTPVLICPVAKVASCCSTASPVFPHYPVVWVLHLIPLWGGESSLHQPTTNVQDFSLQFWHHLHGDSVMFHR